MQTGHQLPVAHLINPNPVSLHSNNLIEMLEHGRGQQGPAITFLDRIGAETTRSYEDLLEGARVVATYLRNRGLQRGDRVIIILMTSSQFTDSFFGTILAGGVPVPASPPMTFGEISKYLINLNHIIRNSEARFLITFPRISKVIGGVLPECHSLKELILAKDIVAEPVRHAGLPSIDSNDPAFFQYTSGTTGLPKGVVLTHRALLSNTYGITQGIELSENDVGVSWLPMFHDMGLIGVLFTGLYARAHLVIMTPESFVMDPIGWFRAIHKYHGTIAVAPNFAYHLCAHRISAEELATLDVRSLKVAFNGAESVDLKTLKVFEDKFQQTGFKPNVIFPVYGMAENCLAATFPRFGRRFEVESIDRSRMEVDGQALPATQQDPNPYQAVSVGRPIAGQQVAVCRKDGGFALEREVGEVLVRGPSLMRGYFRNELETARAIRNGWLHTGDLGFINDGKLFITGRAKEMIIKRGRNYYPYDIERAASKVAGVRKGCLVAFAAPNPSAGTEDLVLVAETRVTDPARKQLMEQEIAAEVLSAIGLKPDRILLVPPRSIPKTSSGKLQRLLCRQRLFEGKLVRGVSERWLAPVRTLVSSFLGHQRFRSRARNSGAR